MTDYGILESIERARFHTIPEVCELLGIDTDKLRYQCLLHDIFPATYQGVLGLDMRSFEIIRNALWMARYSDEAHGDPWA